MRLKNKKISLIASNCNGGVILHDLKLPFDSPFINLWLKPDDFLRFCENMDYYLQQKLIFIKADGIDYPVALLGDVKIYFQHYLSEKDAAYYWQKRAEKLNLNYHLATSEEEAQGIDGFVGTIAYSIKPDTYKTMERLPETINVKMIYYTKTKAGLKIEVED